MENVKTNGGNKLAKNGSKHQTVQASKIHRSTIIPQRSHGEIIAKSVQQVGILQPLIVRPLSGCPGEYELIDGLGRFESLEKDQTVPVEIVDASDIQSFRISNATYQREDQTVLDRAMFFQAWLQVITKQKETKEGAQADLAKELACSEGLISQYLAVNRLFEKLKTLKPNEDFSALKKMDLNRLYQLSKLLENAHLAEVALELEKKPDTTLDEVKSKVVYMETTQKSIDSLSLISDSPPTSGPSPAATMKKVPEATLNNIVCKATEGLNRIGPKLGSLMREIENNTQQYTSTEVMNTISQVLKLLSKLESCTETLSKIANSNISAG